jgi:hypothetical protein
MGGASNGSNNTVPSPEQVLEVFKNEKCGPTQVTAEIRRLAVLLNQVPALTKHRARSAKAYRGWQMLWDALLPHVAEMRDELAKLLIAEPTEAAQYDEHRKLLRLLNALKGAVDTSFILGGRAFADVTPWAHAGTLIATGVMGVLEQSSAKNLGYSESGPVCRVTAKLVSRFAGFGEKSSNAISMLLRGQLKKAGKAATEQSETEWQ